MNSRRLTNSGDWSVTTEDIGMTHIHDEKFARIEEKLDKLCERMSILEEPTPERLEAFKQLQDAYNKYKLLDELCGPHDDGSKD